MELCSIGDESVLQMSPAFNDKLTSVERESRHWSVRWEMFPLKQVTHGQPKSVDDRLLLNSENDMDWDEMNLEWLTEELLSQRFSLPVRTYMRTMEVILLTSV